MIGDELGRVKAEVRGHFEATVTNRREVSELIRPVVNVQTALAGLAINSDSLEPGYAVAKLGEAATALETARAALGQAQEHLTNYLRIV